MSNGSEKIKIAVAGVGNCFSALYQGFSYYNEPGNADGIMSPDIGGYSATDIEVVAAFDIDRRKVGKAVGQAIFSEPNCARVFYQDVPDGPVVQMGEVLDGFSDYMLAQDEDRGFRLSEEQPVNVAHVLMQTGADMLVNYLPVGSEQATQFYAQSAIDAGVAFLNCIPVFIASDPIWEKKFIDAKLPIIGDDMRSAFGASVVSQVMQELAFDRGHKVKFHQQLNIGGNTDFNNMMVQERLASKKQSKENVIRSQNDIRGIPVEKDSLFAGPSNYLAHYKDTKRAYFNLELEGFGAAPVEVRIELTVQDSENSAGVVIDAIRYLKVARELGVVGALRGPSAWTQKTPPEQMMYADAKAECEALAKRQITDKVKSSIIK